MTTYRTIVVVGASLAGWRAARALRELGHTGRLIVIGAEPHAPYDRPPLSKQILTGRFGVERIGLEPADGLGIDLRLGASASGLDLDGRVVTLADGGSVRFDGLVIATGAHPKTLPAVSHPGLPGVHVLRTVDDAVAVRDALVEGARLVVIGAGFVGLEVASSARTIGLDVTVVETAPVPLLRAVGPVIGALVADWHCDHGVDVRLDVGIESLLGASRVEGVRLALRAQGAAPGSSPPTSGGRAELLAADVVVIGVGVAPTTGWLDGSGIDLDDGVRADSRLAVLAGGRALPHVVAAGDLVRWDHPVSKSPTRLEHWTNAVEQGHAAAATLLGASSEFGPVPYFWSDQFDRKIQMVGQMEPGDDVMITHGSAAERRFVAAYGRKGRLVAAVGFGRPAQVMALQRRIAEGAAFPPPP